ncbi:MAG: zf-HC2 domain-containing protein [Planctomycetota bacterium]
MNCEQIRYELPTYLKNEANPEIQTQIESHLDSCLPCVQEKKNLTEMTTLFKQISWIEPSEHFYTQMSEKFAVTFSTHSIEDSEENFLENACYNAWDFFRYQIRNQPIWCLSTFAHAAIVMVLALIFFNPQSSISREELNYQVSLELPKISDQELSISASHTTELRKETDIEQALSKEFQKVAEFATIPWIQKRLDPDTKTQTLLFLGETRQRRDRILSEGLLYFKRCQESDGGFRFVSGQTNEAHRIQTSSLVLLVFLAEGQTHNHGEFKEVVYQGIQFLLRQQRLFGRHKGLIGSPQGSYLYSHSLATYALLENYYLSGSRFSPIYEEILKEALNYLLKYRLNDGGWSYTDIEKNSNLMVSSWPITIFQLALPLELRAQENEKLRTRKFLKKLLREHGKVANQTIETQENIETMARGMFCAQWIGEVFETEILTKQIQTLQTHQEMLQKQNTLGDNLHFWYYGTLACSLYTHQQGELWQNWIQTLLPLVANAQIQEGENQGAIVVPQEVNFAQVGDLYTTAMALLSLQTPYRY